MIHFPSLGLSSLLVGVVASLFYLLLRTVKIIKLEKKAEQALRECSIDRNMSFLMYRMRLITAPAPY